MFYIYIHLNYKSVIFHLRVPKKCVYTQKAILERRL